MASGNAIRGSRVGAGPMGEAERGDAAPRVHISYWCSNGHETRPSFAQEPGMVLPETWDCPRCGFPAGQDKENPPAPPKVEPYKTHLAYVKERRSDADGAAILDEALSTLRERGLIKGPERPPTSGRRPSTARRGPGEIPGPLRHAAFAAAREQVVEVAMRRQPSAAAAAASTSHSVAS